MSRPLITAKNISVVRQGQSILRDVTLCVREKDFVTVVGPNGAGKSMLVRCLTKCYRPDSGHVTHKQGLTLGYVPQRVVFEKMMPMRVRHMLCLRKKIHPDTWDRTIEDIGIGHILDKPMASLSGGMLQRVLLARSLLNEPDMLVLDEPAQNLDVTGQLTFYALLERIYKERPIGILMVSHDLHMVMASTKHVICLFQHICCSGAPQTVTQDPEFIALFGQDMARMMAVYQHHHNHTHD
ncbi:MAG: ATP-binding cassette domain-containing protein [Alphaproteobacteria bacterium GM7ARS4]|nr:ATP-binding cassette domain-containing protein [Alphaproteobacteria bacterium GM7ARS4]